MKFFQHKALVAVLLFLISFLAYSPSLKNGFVWDEAEVIQKYHHKFKVSKINKILIPKKIENKKQRYYRPLVFASIVSDREIWGISPFGYHLSNIIFNSTTTVLLYFLILLSLGVFQVARKESIAVFSTILFALNPMHVESVSWIAGRTDVLCALFFFLAFMLHALSFGNLWILILTSASISLSLLSKEIALAFPIVVMVFDLLSGRFTNRDNFLRYFLYLGLALGYLYLRGRAFVTIPEIANVNFNQFSQITDQALSFFQVLKNLLNSYLFYISKLVFPYDFNAFIAKIPIELYYTLISIFIIVLISIFVLLSIRKKRGLIAFSLLWIFITLGPSVIVAITNIASTPLAERYLYIPSAGYCMLIGYLVLGFEWNARTKKFVWVFATILTLSYLFFTIERQEVWKDKLSLWEHTSTKSYDHALPHTNYGLALENAGRRDEAIKEYKIALDPKVQDSKRGKAVTATNLGVLYLNAEDYGNAERWFREAVIYDPRYGLANYHLGLIYYIKGELTNSKNAYKLSESYLKKTFEIYHTYAKADLVLAKVYLALGEREKARNHAKKALRSGLGQSLSKEAMDILKSDNDSSDY
ncbi:MAG: tetratricopeptide repeat protein [Thermodesulfobacteriota bacterium]